MLGKILQASAGVPAYIGSEKCASCHQIQYKGWVKTFHSTVVGDAKKDPSVIMADMSDPDLPFKKEDIHYTIGGHWDQRYLTKIGDDYYILPRLWSVQSSKWRPYSTYGWQKRPYSKYCIGCHSVGFDPKTRGVVEHSVGCESCHGAGVAHSAKPSRENIVNPKRLSEDRSEEICASCHVRGKDLSGEYFFQLGWKPGDDLAKYYVPLDKNEGESNDDAIHRLWDQVEIRPGVAVPLPVRGVRHPPERETPGGEDQRRRHLHELPRVRREAAFPAHPPQDACERRLHGLPRGERTGPE